MNKSSFFKQFTKPELVSIAGKRYRNFWILVLILLVALLAIGLGKGAMKYLQVRMDNPFIKFITVIIPYGHKDDNNFRTDLNRPEKKSQYLYDNVYTISMGFADFNGINRKDINAYVRGIKKEDPFYKFLVGNSDLVLSDLSTNTFNNTDWGCIVTEGFLKKLGYKTINVPYINYRYPSTKEIIVPLPVCAVVTQLPDYVDMLVGEKLLSAMSNQGENPLDKTLDEHQDYLRLYVQDDAKNEILVKNLQGDGFKELSNIKESFIDGVILEKANVENADAEYNNLGKSLERDLDIIRVYNFDKPNVGELKTLTEDFVTIPFKNLDSVRSFQEYLFSTHKLKIDMNTIEAKENFNFFDKLSKLLSFSLIGFSILAIVIFITNLILAHLEKNKKNLGTLKAFGLSNNYIIFIYSSISVVLIAIAFFLSYILSIFAGNFIINLISRFFDLGEKNAIQFENYPLIVLLTFFLVVPTIIIYFRLRSNLINKTPGDLIYERD